MKKTLKITAIVILSLLLLLIGVQWWLGHKIKNTIEQEISRQSEGFVQIDIARVRVNLISRSVFLGDIRIFTDTLHTRHVNTPLLAADAYIREISARGIHFNKKDSLLSLQARKFVFDLPRLSLTTRKTVSGDSAAPVRRQPASDRQIRLSLQETDIRLGDIHYEQYAGKDSILYDLKTFSCRMTGCQIGFRPDSFPPACKCETMELQFASFRNLFAGQSQLLEIGNLRIQGREKRIFVDTVRLIPQYPEEIFAQKSKNHADWTRIEGGPFICYGVDFGKFIEHRFLQADSAEIRNVNISSFKNRQIPQPKRVKRLFYQSVQQLPFSLSTGIVRLSGIHVRYSELSENGTSPGTVTFSRLNGHFSGLSNVADPGQPDYTLQAEGELFNQGLLQATFTLPKDSLDSRFEVKGKLGAMPLDALNAMTGPLVKIKITSGQVNELEFSIRGNAREAEVDMLFLYNDLKVRIVKEKDGHLKTRSFLTTLANGIIIQGNNPGHRGGPRKVEADAERDIYRSQFNYLWRTLLAGLKKSIGL